MNQTNEQVTDVLIVGAGPTGLTLAHELARAKVTCRIIDKKLNVSLHSKAFGIHARTLEIFEMMGVVQPFLEQGWQATALQFYVHNQKKIQLETQHIHSQYPFILMLSQSNTEKILSSSLEQHGRTVERGCVLECLKQYPDYVHAVFVDQTGVKQCCRARWVVGCDGAHSTVRHALNLSFRGAPYPESFVLADLKIKWALHHEKRMIINISDNGVLAVIPLQHDLSRLLLMSHKHQLSDITLPKLREYANDLAPVPLSLEEPDWLVNFRIHRRMVQTMQVGSVFLAGDAAHIHSPIGGQGMNIGVHDAYNLAWKLALRIRNNVNDEFLKSYHIERYPIVKRVVHTTDFGFRMMSIRNTVVRSVRNYLFPKLLNLRSIQSYLLNSLAEVSWRYRNSPIIDNHHSWWGSHATVLQTGLRAPNFNLISSVSREQCSLYELMQPVYHTLLVFMPVKHAEMGVYQTMCRDINKKYSALINCYQLYPSHYIGQNHPDNQDEFLFNALAHSVQSYYHHKPCYYLIRPDGYIAFRAEISQVHRLDNFLKKIFEK